LYPVSAKPNVEDCCCSSIPSNACMHRVKHSQCRHWGLSHQSAAL
jgi:hypothetical protein